MRAQPIFAKFGKHMLLTSGRVPEEGGIDVGKYLLAKKF